MTTDLQFPREVYAGEAVDQAVKTWASFAEFALSETDDHWIVRVTPKHEDHARRIIGEFGNYVLGLTIDRGGAR
jgi:hypothetical protein